MERSQCGLDFGQRIFSVASSFITNLDIRASKFNSFSTYIYFKEFKPMAIIIHFSMKLG